MAVSPPTTLRERLREGETLPAAWYSDPDVLRLELERIFARGWQYAGPLQALETDGTITCRTGVGQVVVERGPDGDLRTLSPENARVETWEQLVLVNLDPNAPPLASVLGDLPHKLAAHGLDITPLVYRGRSREQVIGANWKIVVENFLECYHCPVAHKGFSKVIDVDPDSYRLESSGCTSSQFGPGRAGDGLPYNPAGEIVESQFHYIWPNWTLNVLPGPAHLRVIVFQPVAPDRTASFVDGFWAPDVPDSVIEEINAFGAEVGKEDVHLVESVQRGLASGGIDHGRLLVGSEHLIQHFQLLVHDALAD